MLEQRDGPVLVRRTGERPHSSAGRLDGAPAATGGETVTEQPVVEGLAVRAGRLFTAYRGGDQTAMADLVSMLTPILWHAVRATRLDRAAAEDVVQTTWLGLVRHADTIAEPVAVLQWMIVSARREAWRVGRGQSRTRPTDFESRFAGEPDRRVTVEDDVVLDEDQHTLWRQIETLPPRCRALLRVIAFAERPDYATLAATLGMPQGSIGPTRGRCLAKLRLALAADPRWETT